MADILEGVEEGIENYLIPEKNSSAPDEVDHDFDAFDNTFITGNGINAGNDYIKSSAICKNFCTYLFVKDLILEVCTF